MQSSRCLQHPWYCWLLGGELWRHLESKALYVLPIVPLHSVINLLVLIAENHYRAIGSRWTASSRSPHEQLSFCTEREGSADSSQQHKVNRPILHFSFQTFPTNILTPRRNHLTPDSFWTGANTFPCIALSHSLHHYPFTFIFFSYLPIAHTFRKALTHIIHTI